MTAAAKATEHTDVDLKEDSAEETDTEHGSDETKEVDLTAAAKATAETKVVLKEYFAGNQTGVW